ncbi:MAG: DNA/RNA non-specific endonuclease [Planctomycetota bacterium]
MPNARKANAGKAYVGLNGQLLWSVHTGQIPQRHPKRNSKSTLLVFTDLYACELDRSTRFADWVGYRVTAASQFGRNSINRNWVHRAKDDTIEAQDYEHSGYSMGHLCPLASVRADADAWQANWTGVVAPQRQELNAGPWLGMERMTRSLAIKHSVVMVACGTLYEQDMPPLKNCDEDHVVPSHFWARVHIPDSGETIAWIMPQSADRHEPEADFRVSLDELDRRARYVFFDE